MSGVTILGLVAATCTTSAFIPQAVKTLRTGSAGDLSAAMYALTTVGILLWLAYGIAQRDVPIIAANVVAIVPISAVDVQIVRHHLARAR